MTRTPTQRLIILTLAMLVLLNGAGFFVLGYMQTGFHRLFESEENEELVSLSMTAPEFETLAWIGKKDFVYKGRVYDVHAVSRKDEKVTVTCYADNEETHLRDSMSGTFNNHEKNNQAVKSTFFAFPVFPVFGNVLLPSSPSTDTVAYNTSTSASPAEPLLSVAAPPPDRC